MSTKSIHDSLISRAKAARQLLQPTQSVTFRGTSFTKLGPTSPGPPHDKDGGGDKEPGPPHTTAAWHKNRLPDTQFLEVPYNFGHLHIAKCAHRNNSEPVEGIVTMERINGGSTILHSRSDVSIHKSVISANEVAYPGESSVSRAENIQGVGEQLVQLRVDLPAMAGAAFHQVYRKVAMLRREMDELREISDTFGVNARVNDTFSIPTTPVSFAQFGRHTSQTDCHLFHPYHHQRRRLRPQPPLLNDHDAHYELPTGR
ncbi:hypothetical protein DXG01_012162 [Tephrocybe rancida]|nr:hypothetical protein DXG01_012162 [Tephrocybe rancida]